MRGRSLLLPTAVVFTAVAWLPACVTTHRNASQCNALVESWDHLSAQYADYSDQISYFQNEVASASPKPRGATFAMTAGVDPQTFNRVTATANPGTADFQGLPDVQLAIQDLYTDESALARQINRTKFLIPANPNDDLLLMFPYSGPITGAQAYQREFGSDVQRIHDDYSRALSLMRDAYRSQCGGDPSEIRNSSQV